MFREVSCVRGRGGHATAGQVRKLFELELSRFRVERQASAPPQCEIQHTQYTTLYKIHTVEILKPNKLYHKKIIYCCNNIWLLVLYNLLNYSLNLNQSKSTNYQ